MFMEILKSLRVPLACALMAGFVLIFLAGAPIVPVAAGCVLSLFYLSLRSWSRLSSGREGR